MKKFLFQLADPLAALAIVSGMGVLGGLTLGLALGSPVMDTVRQVLASVAVLDGLAFAALVGVQLFAVAPRERTDIDGHEPDRLTLTEVRLMQKRSGYGERRD